MKITFALALLLTNMAYSANDLTGELAKCLNGKDDLDCISVGHSAQLRGNFKDALLAFEKACELKMNYSNCDKSYPVAMQISAKEEGRIFKLLEKRCTQNTSLCEVLAGTHEFRNDTSAALKLAKKYSYPHIIFRYGDKKEAFQLALEQCKKNYKKCEFFLYYQMPDDKLQRDKILELTMNECRNTVTENIYYNACTLAGALQFKQGNLEAALELWSLDCKKNTMSCLLIIGSNKFTSEKVNAALLEFCEVESKSFVRQHPEIDNIHCKNIKRTRAVPPAILKFATKTTEFYLGPK